MSLTQVAMAFGFTTVLLAQDAARTSNISTREYDGMGKSSVGSDFSEVKTGSGFLRIEKRESLNGRRVPLESVEERVIRSDSNGRLVERIVKKFDPNGNLASTEKTHIEEHKLPNGSATTVAATYRSDVNGGFQLMEKSTTESRKDSSSLTENTVVERPTLNASLETIERRSMVAKNRGNGKTEQDRTSYRKGVDGNFYPAVRQVTETLEHGGLLTENTARYESGNGGALQLTTQTVRKIVKAPDGTEVTDVEIFSRGTPGQAIESDARELRLKEQELIERKPGAGGAMIETVSVRRPTVADPNRLGAYQKLSETVCTGHCTDKK